jgi:hypothetical protein
MSTYLDSMMVKRKSVPFVTCQPSSARPIPRTQDISFTVTLRLPFASASGDSHLSRLKITLKLSKTKSCRGVRLIIHMEKTSSIATLSRGTKTTMTMTRILAVERGYSADRFSLSTPGDGGSQAPAGVPAAITV